MFLVAVAMARPAYRIVLQADGSSDTMLILGHYYAQHRYVDDTAYNNGKGKFVFEGSQQLSPGLYFITNSSNSRYIELAIYHESPTFQLLTDNHNWVANMQVKGSKQNEVFFNYQRASNRLYEEMMEAKQTLDSAAFVAFRRAQYVQMDSIKQALYLQHPEAMIAKMIHATKSVEEDVPIRWNNGDSLTQRERFDYFMKHYFDNMPLDDDFLLRTPKEIFYQRVMDYTDKYMRGMPPNEICPLLDSLIDRAEPAPDLYRWLIVQLTEKYLQSHVMVYDEVYVHLVQRYFATGKVQGLSPSTVDEQVERASKWERLLVGKVAPELILFDTLRIAHSLHHMGGRYTLLLFWSPTCGHCRDIIPALYEEFVKVADSLNLTAFAILTEPDEATQTKWKQFLTDHHINSPRWVNMSGGEANVDWREVYDITTTPQIYLIENTEHKFIAKKLNAQLFATIAKSL